MIKPGTTSSVYYNHYSWLRTMEDIFGVSHGGDRARLPVGTVSGGIDGQGHLGFAAQAGLAPFGRDVFTNVGYRPWGGVPRVPAGHAGRRASAPSGC